VGSRSTTPAVTTAHASRMPIGSEGRWPTGAAAAPLGLRWAVVAVLLVTSMALSMVPVAPADAASGPPGGTIAFVSDRTGADELYVMGIDGDRVHRLTVNPGFDRAPAWSPDGTELVFNSRRPPHADRPQIYRLRVADPASARRVTSSDTEDLRASWAPDGRSIVFQRGGLFDGPDLIRHELTTGAETPLTDTTAIDAAGTFTPDGRRLLFQRNRAVAPAFFPFRLYALDLATGDVDPVTVPQTSTSASDDGPVVAPDGRSVAFARGGDLLVHDLVEGATTSVTSGPSNDLSPDFAPDGRWLAFQSDRVVGSGGVHLLELATGEVSFVGEGRTPVWTGRAHRVVRPVERLR
jgi:Tol biopolymer transport system component